MLPRSVSLLSKTTPTLIRPFSTAPPRPDKILESLQALSKDGLNKLQDQINQASNGNFPGNLSNLSSLNPKDLALNISKDVTKEVTSKTAQQTSSLLHALILLSRSNVGGGPNVVNEKELEEKLSNLKLPEEVIETIKEQNKMMPADPYMERLKGIEDKLEEVIKGQKEAAAQASQGGSGSGGKK